MKAIALNGYYTDNGETFYVCVFLTAPTGAPYNIPISGAVWVTKDYPTIPNLSVAPLVDKMSGNLFVNNGTEKEYFTESLNELILDSTYNLDDGKGKTMSVVFSI